MNEPNLVQARESSRRLSTLLRHEQGAMADFLVAFAEFPEVVEPLREGKLCITSIVEWPG